MCWPKLNLTATNRKLRSNFPSASLACRWLLFQWNWFWKVMIWILSDIPNDNSNIFHFIWFIDDDKNGNHYSASAIYWASELKCRRFVKLLLCYACVQFSSVLGALIPAFIDIFLLNDDTSVDTSTWNLPFSVVMPFDMRTIWGWFLTWLYQFNICFAYSIYMVTTTTHFVCLCHFIVGICNHFAQLIESVKSDTQRIKMQTNNDEHSLRWQNAKAKLQQSIEMHVNIYE